MQLEMRKVELTTAVLRHDTPRVKQLLEAGADPNAPLRLTLQSIPKDGSAISKDTLDDVKGIVNNLPPGADINAPLRGVKGAPTALDFAVRNLTGGNGALDLIKTLANDGRADLAKADGNGKAPLDITKGPRLGSNKQAYDDVEKYLHGKVDGELRRAVFDGNEGRIKELVRAGADGAAEVNADPSKAGGVTLLAIAAAADKPKIVRELLDGVAHDKQAALVNKKDASGNTALHAAAFSGSNTSAKILKAAGGDDKIANDEGQVPNDIGGLQKRFLPLVAAGAYAIAATSASAAYLWWTSSKGSGDPAPKTFDLEAPGATSAKELPLLTEALLNGNQDDATWRLTKGADPKSEFAPGISDLTYAVSAGQADTVKAILDHVPEAERKAFINAQGVDGLTALHAAGYAGRQDIYDMLKAAGGDETIKDTHGWTAKEALAGQPSGLEARGNPADFTYDPRLRGGANGQNRATLAAFLRARLNAVLHQGRRPDAILPNPPQPPRAGSDLSTQIRSLGDQLQQALSATPALRGVNLPITYGANNGSPYVTIGHVTIGAVPANTTASAGLRNGGRSAAPLEDQQTFIRNQLQDMLTMADTTPGSDALRQLFGPPPAGSVPSGWNNVYILQSAIFSGTAGENAPQASLRGRDAYIRVPDRQQPEVPGNPSWGRNFPTDVSLFHEILHAIDFRQTPADRSRINGVPIAEARTTGLGQFASDPLTENAYRAARNLPRRTYYSNPNELQRSGFLNQRTTWGDPKAPWNQRQNREL